ncbi:MAG: histidine--tRNA ligase [Clostridiales bacterium]|jgi:histidyl-tRNA synthetase|nr:histidine--tRNA ligase [Clostridiales bacterium]
MANSVQPVRGTRDYLPEEVRVRDAIKSIILRSYENNGFSKIQTPMIEDIDRLDKSDGGENLNMIFRILKRGQKLDLTKEGLTEKDLVDSGLRFDLTLPLSRYYANNRAHLRTPFKVIQIGQVFRAERPQKGRLRQFYQCDIDIIGDASPEAEIELIHTTAKTLMELGFDDFTVRINDRRILFDMIEFAGFPKEEVLSVCITFDKLDKIGVDGVKEELLEKGYTPSVIERFVEAIDTNRDMGVSAMADYCSDQKVIEQLGYIIDSVKQLGKDKYKIEYDKSLVRGMGYYTGTIFEIVSPKFKSSIAGGGRYDKMIGNLIGEDIPAVGFSIGFERIAEILLSSEDMKFRFPEKRLALLYEKGDNFVEVLEKADELRGKGYDVCTLVKAKKLGKQLSSLSAEGYESAFIFGQEEIKDLKTEDQ